LIDLFNNTDKEQEFEPCILGDDVNIPEEKCKLEPFEMKVWRQ